MKLGNQFYYVIDNQSFGPIPEEHLICLYKAGCLSGDTLVARVGDEKWISLGLIDYSGSRNPLCASDYITGGPPSLCTTTQPSSSSNGALNLLACFFALPAVGIILLSLLNPNVFMDLWGLAVLSIMVALLVAVCAKLVGK